MPVYNNPAIGQAFNNLADAFRPMSGSETYAYMKAGSEKRKQQRLAELYDLAQDPKLDPQQRFDRMGQVSDLWNPNQGYYAVNTADATDRRGQDITSRTNLRMNAADNARALRERAMMEAAARERQLLGGYKVGENETIVLPPAAQKATGLEQYIMGNINVGEDQITRTPGGDEISGPRSPLSETEFRAAQAGKLRENGQLSDDALLAMVFGSTPVEQVVGPDGKSGFATRPQVLSGGYEPAGSGESSAQEEKIARITESVLADGITDDPVRARLLASSIADGRFRLSRDPLTQEAQVIDVATGRAVGGAAATGAEPDAASAPAPQGAGSQFGEQYPANSEDAFGLSGALTRALNSAGDVIGAGRPYPEIGRTQASYDVLREDLLNDFAQAYDRPPSWLLRSLRELTPSAGSLFDLQGPESAQTSLQSLGQRFANELETVREQMQGELRPQSREKLELQASALQAAIDRVSSALRSFSSPEGRERPAGGQQQPPAGRSGGTRLRFDAEGNRIE